MKRILCWVLLLCVSSMLRAQCTLGDIKAYREAYKTQFLKDEHSPLGKRDLRYLRFFEPDCSFCYQASFDRIVDTVGFMMMTHSGKEKKYYVYGRLQWEHEGQKAGLYVYQSDKLMHSADKSDYLFVPFSDNTNYEETFGGGRYLDFRIQDIVNGQLWIDFNKAYNPYCAYKAGYACPMPPQENKLGYRVAAGEKMFGKTPGGQHQP